MADKSDEGKARALDQKTAGLKRSEDGTITHSTPCSAAPIRRLASSYFARSKLGAVSSVGMDTETSTRRRPSGEASRRLQDLAEAGSRALPQLDAESSPRPTPPLLMASSRPLPAHVLDGIGVGLRLGSVE
jgi:hypothetical protein